MLQDSSLDVRKEKTGEGGGRGQGYQYEDCYNS